jgi:predicted Rossmann-fold nucleotide-binding protein
MHLGSTWTSQKPIAVLNTNGFYDALLVLLETMMKGFFKGSYQMLLVSDDIEDLLNQMKKLCSAYNRKVDYYRNDLRIKNNT